MLESVKNPGDLVSAARESEKSFYVEGIIKRVYEDESEGDCFYDIVWEDGKNFGDVFYQEELSEVDTIHSEAVIRAGLSEFLTEDMLDHWFEQPNARLRGLTPYEALETLGLRKVSNAAIEDYGDALKEDLDAED